MASVPDPAGMRRSYERGTLDESSATRTWLGLFERWFADAASELTGAEANAMQLATVDGAGRPTVRTVLAKGFDGDGVVFFTNLESDKGHDLARLPYAAAVFAWVPLERQVRIAGPVTQVSRAEAAEYFHTRPRGAQVGAWASPQSTVIPGRSVLTDRVREAEVRFGDGPIPLPDQWGGYRIAPEVVEFWQGRLDRLHDRLRYRRDGDGYALERLAP